jgi:hypothetical protein
MTTSVELKEQARLLEIEEQRAYWQKQLADAKTAYEGKCMSSHQFTRKINYIKYPSKSIHIEKVHEVRLKENQGEFSLEYLVSSVWIASSKDKGGVFSFNLSNHVTSHEPFVGWSFMKHEMEPELFDFIFREAQAGIGYLTEHLGKDLPTKEMITQGDHCVLSKHVSQLESIQAPLITINEKQQAALAMMNYVFLHGNKVLNLPGGAQIVRNEIKKLQDSARLWGGKVAERDLLYAQQLQSFLSNHLNLL